MLNLPVNHYECYHPYQGDIENQEYNSILIMYLPIMELMYEELLEKKKLLEDLEALYDLFNVSNTKYSSI